MTSHGRLKPFQPQPPDATGAISWVHIGDLHMTRAGEQNDVDLQAIVEKINAVYAESISFAYMPGDVADDGSRAAYAVVRQSLDKLKTPWCAIVGDHDVHERSFDNFLEAMSDRTYYAFTVGQVRFLALNAFDIPEPPSFTMLEAQLRWAEEELKQATVNGQGKVLLLHCYPSDLKSGGEELSRLIRDYGVRLVDMGHTHYNEVSNDGHTLYTATRSTGQIEEGSVGFSVTNLDGESVSWRFIEPSEPVTVIITSPADERLTPDEDLNRSSGLVVRAKIWSETPVSAVSAHVGSSSLNLTQVPGSRVWQGTMSATLLPAGTHSLRVVADTVDGRTAEDLIRISFGPRPLIPRLPRDQDNQIGAWEEHGLLGSQLGPNKNGKKW